MGFVWRRKLGAVEFTLDGFKDDALDEAETAEGTGGAAHATFEGGSGVAEGGLHLVEGSGVGIGDPGEVSLVAIALGEERQEAAFPGGVKDVVVGEEVERAGINDAVDEEGEGGVGVEGCSGAGDFGSVGEDVGIHTILGVLGFGALGGATWRAASSRSFFICKERQDQNLP
jgi:hypothetical protein